MSSLPALSAENFDNYVREQNRPVLIDFWAPWCGPCRSLAPMLDALAAEFAETIAVAKVNVDDAPSLARRFGVSGIPTLVVLDAGQVVDRQVGVASRDMLGNWLRTTLAHRRADL